MFTTVTSPVASHSANSSSGLARTSGAGASDRSSATTTPRGDALRQPQRPAQRRLPDLGLPAAADAAVAGPPAGPDDHVPELADVAARCRAAADPSEITPPPTPDVRRDVDQVASPARAPRTCSASAPSSASLPTCTGILSTAPSRVARAATSRQPRLGASCTQPSSRRTTPGTDTPAAAGGDAPAPSASSWADSATWVITSPGVAGARGAGSSCAARGSARRGRPSPSPPARPARRRRARPPPAAAGSTISDGRPAPVRCAGTASVDHAGLGEPVDHRLDRAAVEPELGRQRRPGARARRRAAGAAAPRGCAGAPRRAGRPRWASPVGVLVNRLAPGPAHRAAYGRSPPGQHVDRRRRAAARGR